MAGVILQLVALALLVAWASVVWGVAGGLLAGAVVLFFLGMAMSGSGEAPPAAAPTAPGEDQAWIS